MNQKSLIDKTGEVREIGHADMAAFKPAKEVLPPAVYAMLSAAQKPHKTNTTPAKTQVATSCAASAKGRAQTLANPHE